MRVVKLLDQAFDLFSESSAGWIALLSLPDLFKRFTSDWNLNGIIALSQFSEKPIGFQILNNRLPEIRKKANDGI